MDEALVKGTDCMHSKSAKDGGGGTLMVMVMVWYQPL